MQVIKEIEKQTFLETEIKASTVTFLKHKVSQLSFKRLFKRKIIDNDN